MEKKDDINQRLKELSSRDFISSIVLIGACIFVILVSSRMRVYRSFSDSPAIFPVTIATIIGICSISLFIDSIKRGALQEIKKVWAQKNELIKTSALSRIIIIAGMIIIYGFFLVRHMHFTLATFIFLFGIMTYLKIFWITNLLISAGIALSISYVFGTIFNIPLP